MPLRWPCWCSVYRCLDAWPTLQVRKRSSSTSASGCKTATSSNGIGRAPTAGCSKMVPTRPSLFRKRSSRWTPLTFGKQGLRRQKSTFPTGFRPTQKPGCKSPSSPWFHHTIPTGLRGRNPHPPTWSAPDAGNSFSTITCPMVTPWRRWPCSAPRKAAAVSTIEGPARASAFTQPWSGSASKNGPTDTWGSTGSPTKAPRNGKPLPWAAST